jgi:hypothetical protein
MNGFTYEAPRNFGDSRMALSLDSAETQFGVLDMNPYDAIAQRRRGKFVAGSEGSTGRRQHGGPRRASSF